MILVETHAHLDEIEDLGSAIVRAREAGVQAILAVSSDIYIEKGIIKIVGKGNK